jgi:hypothetical protein
MKCAIGILIAAFLISFETQDHSSANTSRKANWVGSYVNEYGTTLTVKDQSLLDITFELVNRNGECQESFHGKAALTSATNALYQDKDNILKISLLRRSDGKIEVTETGFEHSPDCVSFSGIFKPTY